MIDVAPPIVTVEPPEAVDPALLTYLSSMGHCAAVWALLQRDDPRVRLIALRIISRYEQLMNGSAVGALNPATSPSSSSS